MAKEEVICKDAMMHIMRAGGAKKRKGRGNKWKEEGRMEKREEYIAAEDSAKKHYCKDGRESETCKVRLRNIGFGYLVLLAVEILGSGKFLPSESRLF